MNHPKKLILIIYLALLAVLVSADAYSDSRTVSEPPPLIQSETTAVAQSASIEAESFDPPASADAAAGKPAVKQETKKPDPAPRTVVSAPAVPAADPASPARVIIPAMGLNAKVRPVGLTADGRMDVLDNPTDVGWYKYGAKPGEIGSAVLDSHVYQAFAKLKNVKLGDEIQVRDGNGSTFRFKVTDIRTYRKEDSSPLQRIFNSSDKARLNLITCAGAWVPAEKDYTHRLVVYAELVG